MDSLLEQVCPRGEKNCSSTVLFPEPGWLRNLWSIRSTGPPVILFDIVLWLLLFFHCWVNYTGKGQVSCMCSHEGSAAEPMPVPQCGNKPTRPNKDFESKGSKFSQPTTRPTFLWSGASKRWNFSPHCPGGNRCKQWKNQDAFEKIGSALIPNIFVL